MNPYEPIMYLCPKEGVAKELYLSDSQVKTFESKPWEWFDDKVLRLPRKPQLPVMAVGSGFDSFVKHALSVALYGKDHPMTAAMEGQFESSVEAHNRHQARLDGQVCFDEYVKSGRYNQLLGHLEKADSVFFESDVRRPLPAGYSKKVHHDDCYTVPVDVYDIDEEKSAVAGQMQIVPGSARRMHVKMIAKPDLGAQFVKDGILRPEIYDWKVNGFYSSKGATIQPQKFQRNGQLITCKRGYYRGPEGINPDHKMDWPIPVEWMCQLHLYTHLTLVHMGLIPEDYPLNETPLFDTHVGIDQLAWFPNPRRMEVYQYVSEANDNRYTHLHEKISMVVTAIVHGWWDPWCGSKQKINEQVRGRINSSMDTTMASLCKVR